MSGGKEKHYFILFIVAISVNSSQYFVICFFVFLFSFNSLVSVNIYFRWFIYGSTMRKNVECVFQLRKHVTCDKYQKRIFSLSFFNINLIKVTEKLGPIINKIWALSRCWCVKLKSKSFSYLYFDTFVDFRHSYQNNLSRRHK